MRHGLLIPLFLSLIAANAEPDRTKSLRWQSDVCARFRQGLPSDYTQGFVEVPEDWDDPASEKIKVFYYGRLIEGQEPVVFFNGGPAYPSHSRFHDFKAQQGLADRTLIFVDQRGTGCSTPLPELTPEALHRYRRYTSRAIVKDAEAIRQVVTKGKPWTIIGNSYGGLIVRRYLEMAPDALKRAVSHGFTPTSTVWPLGLRLAAAQRNQKEAERRFPSLKDDLPRFRDFLRDNCYQAPVRKICGGDLIQLLSVGMSYVSHWELLANDLRHLLTTKGTAQQLAYKRLGEHFFLESLRPTPEINWAADVISNAEVQPDSNKCLVAFRALVPPVDPHETVFSPCGNVSPLNRAGLINPADPVRTDLVKANLAKRPDLKFFVFGGELDSIMPPSHFDAEMAALGGLATFKFFPSSGHDGYKTEREVLEAAYGPLPNWGKPPPEKPSRPEPKR